MSQLSRRNFLKAGAAVGAAAGLQTAPIFAERASATDWVTLGNSGVKVTRLAFGTGTHNGRVQQQLGQQEFTRLVRYAYERGIRFFETAEQYGPSQQMLGTALKGLPRDSYRLMTKVTTSDDPDPLKKLDELCKNCDTEYYDIMLLHGQRGSDWVKDTRRWQDAILEAQSRKTILARGASVHGLPALRQVPGCEWLQVAMIRMNHEGVHMDNETDSWNAPGDVKEVVARVHETRAAGMGVISMKLAGEGTFVDRSDRQKSMRFAFRHAGIDCATVGYKSTTEIDEAIDNMNQALA